MTKLMSVDFNRSVWMFFVIQNLNLLKNFSPSIGGSQSTKFSNDKNPLRDLFSFPSIKILRVLPFTISCFNAFSAHLKKFVLVNSYFFIYSTSFRISLKGLIYWNHFISQSISFRVKPKNFEFLNPVSFKKMKWGT